MIIQLFFEFTLGMATNNRTNVGQKKKPQLQRFAEALKPYLEENGATALNRAARVLNQEEGFEEAKGNLTFLQFVRLFPMFKTTGSGRALKVELR